MTKEELRSKSSEEICEFITNRLAFSKAFIGQFRHSDFDKLKKEHRRFEMSGYDEDGVGSCTVFNTNILNEFADVGIYDYTTYLFLDFYKGAGTLYYQYFFEEDQHHKVELCGYGTVGIIYAVLEKTVLSGKKERRRI